MRAYLTNNKLSVSPKGPGQQANEEQNLTLTVLSSKLPLES